MRENAHKLMDGSSALLTHFGFRFSSTTTTTIAITFAANTTKIVSQQ
jgi:hypothetical protein